jgi:histidine triad (HIT) family protein
MNASACVFCRIINKELSATIIAENDHIIVIKDIHPKAPTHLLIIPKKHISDISALAHEDTDLASDMLFMAKQLSQTISGASSFKLMVNNGKSAGQIIFHLHIHFLAGKEMLHDAGL